MADSTNNNNNNNNNNNTASVCLPNSLKIPSLALDTTKTNHHPQQQQQGHHHYHHSSRFPRSIPAVIIAHRGASAHFPEHTLPAYRLALELGADYIEPDLVTTRDGHLIALHTVDLNVTTNVVQVFGTTKDPQPSSFHNHNKTGYWTFDFTLEEIQQLTVRQRLPKGRTTQFDYQYTIPTLTQIVQLVNQWNTIDLPQQQQQQPIRQKSQIDNNNNNNHTDNNKDDPTPHPWQYSQAGIYAELKDREWILHDTTMDLVELLLDHLQNDHDLWQPLQHCFATIPVTEFMTPPLVVQSFSAQALQDFHTQWQKTKDSLQGVMAEPPYILLVNSQSCWEDDFWFSIIENDYRSFLSGLGVEKTCVLDDIHGQAFSIKAQEMELLIHVWTERPETEFLYQDQFDTTYDEIMYLLCETNTQGVFTESVSMAVSVVNAGCTTKRTNQKEEDDDDAENGFFTNMTWDDSSLSCAANGQEHWLIGIGSFVLGISVAVVAMIWTRRRQKQNHRQGESVPTVDDDLTLHQVEMT